MKTVLKAWILACAWLGLLAPVQAVESPFRVIGAITVDVHEARELFDDGATFVDVRSDRQWRWGHIEGAIHLELRRDFGKLFSQNAMDRDTPLVIYCNDLGCQRSSFASYLASQWGYTRVYYFRNGYFAWQARDFPMQSGSDERVHWAER